MGGQAPGPLPGTGKQKGVLLTLPWGGGGGMVLRGAVGFIQGNPQELFSPPMSMSILFHICMYLLF